MNKLLALFGFAPTATQASTPPLLAYLLVILAGYFSAEIIELSVWVLSKLGDIGRYTSVALRTIGVTASLFVAHGAYRVIVHGDEYSWSGYVRSLLKRA